MFRKPISWLGMEKLNLTQQKHAYTNQFQKKCTTTQNKLKKTKARFSRLLRPPVWKLKGWSNKQIIYIMPKSTNESSTYYAPEPAVTDKYTSVCK